MIAALVDEWPVILIAAVVVALGMVLAYRLLNRRPRCEKDSLRVLRRAWTQREEEPAWPELHVLSAAADAAELAGPTATRPPSLPPENPASQ